MEPMFRLDLLYDGFAYLLIFSAALFFLGAFCGIQACTAVPTGHLGNGLIIRRIFNFAQALNFERCKGLQIM